MIRWLDRSCLAAMALGVGLMLQPWWTGGFATGFWLVLAGTIGQIVTSHMGKT
jgi:hypothetical protein